MYGFEHYAMTHETADRRVRWVHDHEYQSEGSFAYATDTETDRAVAQEERGITDGDLVALGAIVETCCGECGEWKSEDSLWGIVASVGEDLDKLGTMMLDIPA